MSNTEPVRSRARILTQANEVAAQTIAYATTIYGNDKTTNLRPEYQRELRWTLEQYCQCVHTIMIYGHMPHILLYKLQKDDERDIPSLKYECIDGQHRLNCIFHFRASEPIVIKGKEEMIFWYHEASDCCVFYKRNAQTDSWTTNNPERRVAYFTEDEVTDFDDYKVTFETIVSRLTYDQRCEQFVKLQQGIPVRNSDLYKNFNHIPLIAYISKVMRLQASYQEHVAARSTENAKYQQQKQNWVFCAVRLCMIAIASSEEDRLLWINTTDTQVKQSLTKKAPTIMNISEEQLQQFQDAIHRWFQLLSMLEPNQRLTPIQLLSTFTRLQELEVGQEDQLLCRLTSGWTGQGLKDEKKMWFQKAYLESGRQCNYFEDCLSYLRSSSPPLQLAATAVAPRKSLSKKKRMELWERDFGKKRIGACSVCSDELKKGGVWHAGHLVAHAKGGSDTDLDNFGIECATCNLEHGTEDPRTFKKRNYSE
uniref:GmrSD restriction endonucleases N-terminal domain-containing protein n=1 Tax=viral metagenome TaxID=1070528 RepID=A0A6C0I4W2_9ZZZZ